MMPAARSGRDEPREAPTRPSPRGKRFDKPAPTARRAQRARTRHLWASAGRRRLP